jgi:hypothetical protein
LDNVRRWISCFEGASIWQTGYALRRLFFTAVTVGDLVNPLALWQQFTEKMCHDIPHRRVDVPPDLPNPHLDYGLFPIAELLQQWEKTLTDMGLPAFQHQWTDQPANPMLERGLDLQSRSTASP